MDGEFDQINNTHDGWSDCWEQWKHDTHFALPQATRHLVCPSQPLSNHSDQSRERRQDLKCGTTHRSPLHVLTRNSDTPSVHIQHNRSDDFGGSVCEWISLPRSLPSLVHARLVTHHDRRKLSGCEYKCFCVDQDERRFSLLVEWSCWCFLHHQSRNLDAHTEESHLHRKQGLLVSFPDRERHHSVWLSILVRVDQQPNQFCERQTALSGCGQPAELSDSEFSDSKLRLSRIRDPPSNQHPLLFRPSHVTVQRRVSDSQRSRLAWNTGRHQNQECRPNHHGRHNLRESDCDYSIVLYSTQFHLTHFSLSDSRKRHTQIVGRTNTTPC
ncbi:hypothetical protein BLNAU_19549 [Blattamonas nauphoetae]|uniref:Uncharacterized protein n=1 Tax=Blattamonas nauphoetae TaxID=2049346 RepID=A0ABQ9X1G5_9EUKA|nr:hypothetical protein BLNAU_19549 [Blattamonas nauphoetae]